MILGKERDLQVLWTKLICIYIYDILPCIRLYFFFFFFLTHWEGLGRRKRKANELGLSTSGPWRYMGLVLNHCNTVNITRKQVTQSFLFPSAHKSDVWEFPGGPVVRTLCFYCRGHGVLSLFGKLSYKPHSVTQKKKKKK